MSDRNARIFLNPTNDVEPRYVFNRISRTRRLLVKGTMSAPNDFFKFFDYAVKMLAAATRMNKCHVIYGKCSKISTNILFLTSNKMLVFRAGIHKIFVKIANREDPDQIASSEAV